MKPSAYRAFLETGNWPDKTVFILELRSSASHGSINKAGHYQTDLVAIEAAVKDEHRFKEKWAYFSFSDGGNLKASTKPFAGDSACNTCHSKNAAVENTFVQFYPTLLEVATAKKTLNAGFPAPAPTVNSVIRMAESGGWSKVEAVLEDVRLRDPQADVLQEGSLAQIGTRLAGDKKVEEAVGAFAYATRLFPGSAGAYWRLSEAYAGLGKKTQPLSAAEQVLALLPTYQSGEDDKKMLEAGARARVGRQ